MANLIYSSKGMKKADWDVGLAVDAIRLSNLVDAVVIVSGDGDFIPLLEYIKFAMGIQVEVMAFGRSASGKLKEMVDDFTDLGAEPGKYTLRIPGVRVPSRRGGGSTLRTPVPDGELDTSYLNNVSNNNEE